MATYYQSKYSGQQVDAALDKIEKVKSAAFCEEDVFVNIKDDQDQIAGKKTFTGELWLKSKEDPDPAEYVYCTSDADDTKPIQVRPLASIMQDGKAVTLDSGQTITGAKTFTKKLTVKVNPDATAIDTDGYIECGWLRSKSIAKKGEPTGKIAVMDTDNWLYYRTTAEVMREGNAVITNTAQTITGAKKFKDISSGSSSEAILSVEGNTTMSGNLTVGGNLTVSGTTTTIDSQTLQVKDKLIEVARGNTTELSTPAGLIAQYNESSLTALVFDNTGTAYVGDATLNDNKDIDITRSNLQPLATRSGLTKTTTSEALVAWDADKLTLKSAKQCGGKTQPVYITENGTIAAIDYTIEKSVPKDAVFTDTTYGEVTQTQNGLMKATDKIKLDTNVVTVDGRQTISGVKTFTSETQFTNSAQCPTWYDIAYGIGKSSLFTRGAFMQAFIGQIIAPYKPVTIPDSEKEKGYSISGDTIKFQRCTGSEGGQPKLEDMAELKIVDGNATLTVGGKKVITEATVEDIVNKMVAEKIADTMSNYVTLDGKQTITGEKTFKNSENTIEAKQITVNTINLLTTQGGN